MFPFGEAVGDNLVTPAFDGSSPIIFKAIVCPFFGVQEDTLVVSMQWSRKMFDTGGAEFFR